MDKRLMVFLIAVVSFECAFTQSVPFKSVEAVKKYFEEGVLLINRAEWIFDPVIFPTDDYNFFYIRYDYKDEKIDKKLEIKEKRVVVLKKDLLKIDGKSIAAEEIKNYELFYFKKLERKSERLTSIQFHIIDQELLILEIKNLIEEYNISKKGNDQITTAVQYLWRAKYGNMDRLELKMLVQKAR